MSGPQVQFIEAGLSPKTRRIAYLTQAGDPAKPGIMWLAGLKSDMVSTKAEALSHFTNGRNQSYTRFDYSGHGQSEGHFETATVGDWLEEAKTVFSELTTGAQIIVGSSTGAHIALLLLRNLLQTDEREATRLRGLVLIAPAWDLTEELMWNVFSDEAKREVMEQGFTLLPSEYDEPFKITRKFIEDGRNHLLGHHTFNPGRPVTILQGAEDTAVPIAHAKKLHSLIEAGWSEFIEVPDGEHRMSRPQDLELLYSAIERQTAKIIETGT